MKFFPLLVLSLILTSQFGMNRALFVLKWNKRLGTFNSFPGTDSWAVEKQKQILHSRHSETYNFNGEILHLTHFEEPSYVQFYENETKVTGINGEIWTTLSKLLNFKLRVTRSYRPKCGPLLANGSFDGTLEYARLNQTDIIPKMSAFPERFQSVHFTTGFWINQYRIFAHVQPKRNRDWMFKIFSTEVWCVVCVYILAFSIGKAVTESVKIWKQRSQQQHRSFLVHLFNTFRLICNQGDIVNPTRDSKILVFTVSLFAYLLLTAFCSRSISGLQREIISQPDISFESLYKNGNIRTVVTKGSICYSLFSKTLTEGNQTWPYTVASDHDDLYNKVCLNSDKNVLCDGTDEVMIRRSRFCGLIRSEESLSFHIIAGISKRVKHKRSLDIGIMKLRESGIIEGLRTHYLSRVEKQAEIRKLDSMAIDIPQISMILVIFGVGIVASIVICLAENIFFALEKRKTNKYLVQRYHRLHKAVINRYEMICDSMVR